MSPKKNKKKKWKRVRHLVARQILSVTVGSYSKLRYKARVDKFKEQEKRPYLVLFNHQTPFDQFFVGMSIKGQVYYVASEDIFSNGWTSSVIKFLQAPIPIKKSATDIKAVLNCMKVIGEGCTVAMAPEGNRTYSGKTEYISPSVVPLARKFGVPIVLYRIEGGYAVHPRWGDKVRGGKMHCYVARVIDPSEYAEMSNDELFEAIKEGLYVNDAASGNIFKARKSAEYIERAFYTCPFCGLSELESEGNTVKCKKCGRVFEYLPTMEIVGRGCELPFRHLYKWYDSQSALMNSLDVLSMTESPVYTDTAALFEVIPSKRKQRMAKECDMKLYGDRLVITYGNTELELRYDDVTAEAVLGRNKLNVYHGGRIYQFKGSRRFNAVKYVHFYYRYKNTVKKGINTYAEFLGL